MNSESGRIPGWCRRMSLLARYFFLAYLGVRSTADVENGGKIGVVWLSKRASTGCKWSCRARKGQKNDVDLGAKVSLVLGIISPYSCTQAKAFYEIYF
jgi:hypothetical protein